jgi:hypothetical protein
MKKSETISKLSAAILKAQREIKFAAKDATNPHFRNKYADLPAVIDAIKSALNDAGIAFVQTGSPSEPGTLHLTTTLLHESGEWIEDTLTMPLPKNDPQGYGSAMTYARRYALAAITGLYQDDDDGNAASGSQAKGKGTITPTTGVRDSLDAATRVRTDKLAVHIEAKFTAGDEWAAFEAWETRNMDADESTAVWSLLGSKTRSRIKAMKAEADKRITA